MCVLIGLYVLYEVDQEAYERGIKSILKHIIKRVRKL